jgi:ABC-type nitrate/sulfonate/bicarbonate transport system substrate-binding protein
VVTSAEKLFACCAKGSFSEPTIAVQLGGKFMLYLYVMRLRAIAPILCIATALFLAFDASAAHAAKIKMVFPGPVTTFSLPYLVAQKKGWMEGLEVEDVHVTGDANAMRVLLSGNADIGLIGTLNVLASIHAGDPGNRSAITVSCWRRGRATSSLISPARPSHRPVPAACPTSFRA